MGLIVRYVEADKKTGRLSYRRVFTPALRPFLPNGQRELKRSLRARSLHSPEAMTLYAECQAEFARLEALATKAAEGRYDILDASTIAWLVEAFIAEALEQDEAARWDAGERELYSSLASAAGMTGQFNGEEATRWATKRRETLEASVAHSRALLGRGDQAAIVETWGWEADQFAYAKGLRLDTSSPQFAGLCVAICRASLRAAESGLARLDGDSVETPAEPKRPRREAVAVPAAVGEKSETMDSLAEKLLGQATAPVTRTTAQAWQTALRFWRETHGEIACSDITRRKVSALDRPVPNGAERPQVPTHGDARQSAYRSVALKPFDKLAKRYRV